MDTDEHIKELIHLLQRATEEHAIDWQITADENAFRLSSSLGNIRVTRFDGFDQEMMESYTARNLCILNEKGRVIEEYTPTMGRDEMDFDRLFQLARRSAYNTESIVEGMIKSLKEIVPQ